MLLLSFAQFSNAKSGRADPRQDRCLQRRKGLLDGLERSPWAMTPIPTLCSAELVANPTKPPRSRTLFQLYLKLGSLHRRSRRARKNTWPELQSCRVSSKGKHSGGRVIVSWQIYNVDYAPLVFPLATWPAFRFEKPHRFAQFVEPSFEHPQPKCGWCRNGGCSLITKNSELPLPATVLVHPKFPTQLAAEA